MINVFYGYGLIWLLVLFLYFLGWSDLCFKLDNMLIVFIICAIIISIVIGFVLKKQMKFIKLQENPHKKNTVTIVLVIAYLLDLAFARSIPILNVLSGISYLNVDFSGIPIIHNFISAFAIFYSIYLSYLFFCFKDKRVLIENCLVVSFFVILMQRQNILICLILFCNIGLASSFLGEINKKIRRRIIISLFALVLLILYLFGVMGNIRYGSNWKWNDSSMISALGKMNSKYPDVLPKEYFWSYIYIVSPLVNLNYNIIYYNSTDNIEGLVKEFIPEFISNRIFSGDNTIKVNLPVKSLNASTAYVRVYLAYGFFGMFLLFGLQMIISFLVVYNVYKYNREYFVVVCNALVYFLFFTFFANTFVYSTTALVLFFAILCCRKIRIKN